MERNTLIEPEDYFAGYKKSIEDLKHNPQIIAFDKLCYELFEHQEAGREFIKIITERYLIPSMSSRGNPTYQVDVLWQEGFKDFARMLIMHVQAHKQRMIAELNNDRK
jgi:hypothetical protein